MVTALKNAYEFGKALGSRGASYNSDTTYMEESLSELRRSGFREGLKTNITSEFLVPNFLVGIPIKDLAETYFSNGDLFLDLDNLMEETSIRDYKLGFSDSLSGLNHQGDSPIYSIGRVDGINLLSSALEIIVNPHTLESDRSSWTSFIWGVSDGFLYRGDLDANGYPHSMDMSYADSEASKDWKLKGFRIGHTLIK